jgi:DNA-binding XRE family transcriptional regulator
MKTNYEKDLENRLKNEDFRKEYEALESEYIIIQAIIDARKKMHLTQKQLSQRTGINQADISKIETGVSNPTLRMLNRLAEGMNMILRIEFEPREKS